MSEQPKNNPSAENPEKFTGLELHPPSAAAAGIPGVLQAFKHILQEVGAVRGFKALSQLNQKGGFDCPSCAWPDPDDERSGLAEYCENGAKAVADEATSKKIGASFFATHSVSELSILNDMEIGKKGRIAEPMYLAEGGTHYQPISWEMAFKKIAAHLNQLQDPNEAIFYTSGRTSNEAAFLYQLFIRAFGTNNLPDCSNMCHESSGIALIESLGIGKGSVTLEDFYCAEVILIIGQNPGTNHPRMLSALQKAKKNGAVIIAINPIPETGFLAFSNPQQLAGILGKKEKLADIFLPIKLNADMALFQAISKLHLENPSDAANVHIDYSFIHEKTEGFEQFKKHLDTKSLKQLIEETGLSEDEVFRFFQAIKNKSKIIACWAMGLTQHKQAVDTIKEVVNFLLLKGSIGKSGAGTCPVRGHSNVQGDRTMGINEKPTAAFLDSLENRFGFNMPRAHGFDVVESIKAMYQKKAKVFFALGGNFLSATPDTLFTADALRNCNLTVQVSTKLNRSHLVHGKEAIILPCLGRSDRDIQSGVEQFVSCENSMGIVQSSQGRLHPVSEQLLSEPAIVCRLAKAVLGSKHQIAWDSMEKNYDLIRNEIEATIPGFEKYNERIKEPGGFYLPNCNRIGKFDTDSGKAKFNQADSMPIELKQDELLMMTIRSHDQFNTTIYGLDDRYRGVSHERRIILMNRKDMDTLGIAHLQPLDIINEFGGRIRRAANFLAVEYPIAERCVATYFPEANVLVPVESTADKSNTPTSKSIIVKLTPHMS